MNGRIVLTQVPKTGGNETRSYQRLAVDVVPLSLQFTENKFHERTERVRKFNSTGFR